VGKHRGTGGEKIIKIGLDMGNTNMLYCGHSQRKAAVERG
jgi:hypothetical protein